MFISTRELLGQTGDRSTYQAVIERHYGDAAGTGSLLEEPILSSIIKEMGAGALSNEALQRLADALSKRSKDSAPSADLKT